MYIYIYIYIKCMLLPANSAVKRLWELLSITADASDSLRMGVKTHGTTTCSKCLTTCSNWTTVWWKTSHRGPGPPLDGRRKFQWRLASLCSISDQFPLEIVSVLIVEAPKGGSFDQGVVFENCISRLSWFQEALFIGCILRGRSFTDVISWFPWLSWFPVFFVNDPLCKRPPSSSEIGRRIRKKEIGPYVLSFPKTKERRASAIVVRRGSG